MSEKNFSTKGSLSSKAKGKSLPHMDFQEGSQLRGGEQGVEGREELEDA